jgi:hypothetical protein
MIYAVFALWGAIGWRLRGGAFTAIAGLDPTTTGARILFGSAWFALPLVCGFREPDALLLVPTLFLSLVGEGWSGYSAVYFTPSGTRRHAVVDDLLDSVRFASPLTRNLVGLCLCGLWLALPTGVTCWWLHGVAALWLALLGPWMSFAYWLPATIPLPRLGRFAVAGTEWGEALVGAALAPLLLVALGG